MDCDKVERLRDRLLMCPICMDEYKDPRLLPCHHTVCLDCIDSYLHASSITGRMFRCPQCRRDIHVPRGGTSDFPLNFYIISLQDELGSRTYNDTCDACKRDWMISQYRCVDCDMVICRFCIHEHRLFQHEASRQYNIMRIEVCPADVGRSSCRPCPVHPDQLLQVFCCTCDEPVCITCICHGHRRHETVTMETKLATARTSLQEELNRLDSESCDVQETLTHAGEVCRRVSERADRVKGEVRDRGRELHLKIDVVVERLLKEVSDSETKTLQELDAYSKDLKQYRDEADKGKRFLEDLQQEDMCMELLDCYDRYNTSLKEQKSKSADTEFQLKQFSFTGGWDYQFTNYFFGSVGHLRCETSRERFLMRKGPSDGYSGRRIASRLLVPRNIAKLLVVLFMLFTMGRMIHTYVTQPVYSQGVGIGLALCSYLFLAAYFAYRKS